MYISNIKSVILKGDTLPIIIQRESHEIKLPASKSESNRALILAALCGSECHLSNLSDARDTQTLQALLASDNPVLDVLDAGTAMRFLTAYCAIRRPNTVLTGTERMQARPLLPLTQALQTLGCQIHFEKQTGFAPLSIDTFNYSNINQISIRADISSQFISALLMTAPCLPDGLTLTLEGEIGSLPYIMMTMAQMQAFGGIVGFVDQHTIRAEAGGYQACAYSVESDWSAASYWYGMVALDSRCSGLVLLGLKENSLQGDKVIVDLMAQLGVQTVFETNGVRLIHTQTELPEVLHINFQHCPDLAQTMAVVCAALGVRLVMSGVASLHIKETDRIIALKQELSQFGIEIASADNLVFEVKGKFCFPMVGAYVHTYQDHRMAMSFAMLGVLRHLGSLEIEQPAITQKSYPSFWEHLGQLGLETTFVK